MQASFEETLAEFDISKLYIHQLSLPGHILSGNIQEDEEALIIRGVGFVGLVHGAHFLHLQQVDHMDVNLLGNGRGVEWILYCIVLWPLSAVHIQVPVENEILSKTSLYFFI
jgi:hypothetical protein